MPKRKTKTAKLLPELADWTLEDLRDLQSALATLIEKTESEEEQERAKAAASNADTGIELKWITRNGKRYGPYRYERWWENGKHKSRYLGRASSGGTEGAGAEKG